MKANKTNLFFITLLIIMMLSSAVTFAAAVGRGRADVSSGRTYTNESGQTYSADEMQSDYEELARSVRSAASIPSYVTNSSVAVANSIMRDADSWYKTNYGYWYYFVNNRTETKKGWFDDPTDGQRYYLDPDNNGVMLVGWQTIDGYDYYFNESHNNELNWYDTGDGWYESLGKQVVAYGSLLKNTVVDGRELDGNGRAK